MAETASEPASMANISALFTHCMEILDAFASEGALGKEFQVSALKLAVLQLRLLRWRKSVALDDEGSDDSQPVTASEKRAISRLLEDILYQLERAEAISSRYAGSKTDGAVASLEPDTDSIEAVSGQVRRLSERRQSRMPFLQQKQRRLAWAVKDGKNLETLVIDLTDRITMLVELLPRTKVDQIRQARSEAQELISKSREAPQYQDDVLSAPWLKVAVSSVDQDVGACLKSEASSAMRHESNEQKEFRFRNVYVRGNAVAHFGDVSVEHQFNNVVARDNARVHYGDNFGSKSIFDD